MLQNVTAAPILSREGDALQTVSLEAVAEFEVMTSVKVNPVAVSSAVVTAIVADLDNPNSVLKAAPAGTVSPFAAATVSATLSVGVASTPMPVTSSPPTPVPPPPTPAPPTPAPLTPAPPTLTPPTSEPTSVSPPTPAPMTFSPFFIQRISAGGLMPSIVLALSCVLFTLM